GHRQPLAPEFVSTEDFSPLEVAYDFGRITREQIEAGPRNIWRYKSLLPVPSNVEEYPNTEPGCTKLIRADRPAKELGVRRLWGRAARTGTGTPTPSRAVPSCAAPTGSPRNSASAGCGSRTTPATPPTHSRTAWSRWRSPPPANSASTCWPARRPATWPTP